MKKKFCPGRDLNSRPSRTVNQQVFINLLLQIGIILTAYEVNLNHQYLFIFSVDFHVFGHCSISIPHRSQKDPLYALAYFLVYFSWFSAVCNMYTRQIILECMYVLTCFYDPCYAKISYLN